ncbi:hypothetical protein AB835_13435 [Candidatus Endobugula sertula]|uniref:Filamentous haemagglutinin FhaB/tRNA nuclease CdiA-like TPS domain-containing protein n=1 Tax=Candidatus Endobugula sertula TaxID=62101 RepID=A0A1D2QLW3_9GAMM|nr:hypothetical protein AB835_13435 [Candidatus Endobugula sertula]
MYDRLSQARYALSPGFMATLSSLRVALLLASGSVLFSHDAFAQIFADPNASQSEQATILSTANGIPQVNIQTPSAAGVSRNQYRQFDVDANGVILNNSRLNTTTQLGGMVSANPNLIGGEARIIVNEIYSSNPSYLNGFIEVAGSRADVVFANPAGISCSGCGFINAHQATLTTGKPIYNNGNLDSYRVEGGTVDITGTGLDASSVDYTHIIARSVKVNAGIWGQQVNVVTGLNDVKANTTADATEHSSGTSTAPTFAIDVSALGGMYAGKIKLVGTEDGVGVRNAGQIGAGAGGFTLSADGRLTNTQQITSDAAIAISTREGVNNSGTVYASQTLTLNTESDIQHSGTIAAQDTVSLMATGNIVSDSNSILAAGIDATGQLINASTSSHLQVISSGEVDLQGEQLVLNDLSIQADRITLQSTQTAESLSLHATLGDVTLRNSTTAADTFTVEGQGIAITDSQQTVNNATLTASTRDVALSDSTVNVTEQLTISTPQQIVTDRADITAKQLQLTAHSLSNQDGKLKQSGNSQLTLQLAGTLDNTDGQLATNSALTINSQQINNHSGILTSVGDLALTVDKAQATSLDNTLGTIASDGQMTLTSGSINNDQGHIQSAKNLAIDTQGNIVTNTNSGNTGGVISGDALTVKASTMNNDAGYIGSAKTLNITTSADSSNQAGIIEGADSVTLDTAALNNDQGRIQSGTTLSIDTHGNSLTNTDSGDNGGLISGDALDINASSLNNDAGYVGAQKALTVTTTDDSTNQAGIIEGAENVSLNTAALNNDQGRIQSGSTLSIDTNDHLLTNTHSGDNGGLISGDTLDINASRLNNDAG